MSAVEYRCPVCGHRLYTEPNSPIKYHCPNEGVEYSDGSGRLHPEALVIQVQESDAPNFLYLEEGEVNPAKTGVLTPGATGGDLGRSFVTPVVKHSTPVIMTEEEELDHLRNQWERLTGHPADRRYKAPRLRQEIEGLEYSKGVELEQAATKEAQEQIDALEAEHREQLKEELRNEILAELRAGLAVDITDASNPIPEPESETSNA